MFKKSEKVCIAFSGALFDKNDVQDLLFMKLGQAVCAECEYDTFKMFEAYLEISEFTSLFGELFLLDAADFDKHKDSKKWFIGVHLEHMPEWMSKKRFNIDVREMLVKCRLIDESETDANKVKFYFDVATVKC